MVRMFGHLLDDTLLIVLLVATVTHIAGFMQVYEEPALWWAAWLQAIGIDLATLRASYLYKMYRPGQARKVALTAVIFFSLCSGILNMAYYVRAGAYVLVAVPMAVFFPVAITILSYLRGAQDILDERRDKRLAGRTSGHVQSQPVRPLAVSGQTPPGHPAGQRDQVRNLRAEGLTLREISARTGVPRSTVGEWLRAQADKGATEVRPPAPTDVASESSEGR